MATTESSVAMQAISTRVEESCVSSAVVAMDGPRAVHTGTASGWGSAGSQPMRRRQAGSSGTYVVWWLGPTGIAASDWSEGIRRPGREVTLYDAGMAVDRYSTKGKALAAMNRGYGACQRGVYRISGGRLMGKTAGVPVLLLTVTGRRTAKKRTVPLIYWERDGEYIVSASAAGMWTPMWYRNLRADPKVSVQVGRRRFAATAHLADANESRDLWAVTESLNSRFGSYRDNLGHDIPMVVLRPNA